MAHLGTDKMRELAAGGRPWSLVASFWGPHQPCYPSEPYASMIAPRSIPEHPTFRDDLSGRPLRHHFAKFHHHVGACEWRDWATWQEILARCYGQALQLDAAVGRLLDALDETGAAQNTLVIWLADHGDAVASHGGLWDKDAAYTEEVARVPMAARRPAAIPPGQRSQALVSNMDATATMLAAPGAGAPEDMDSRSLLPLCRGSVEWPECLIVEHNGHGGGGIVFQRIAIRWPFKYVAALYDGDELYDLEGDPFEVVNLIGSPCHEGVRRELRGRLLDRLRVDRSPDSAELVYSLEHGF